ncbi:2-keto-4-pentenoate hydratase/2-oxohepta-3-ene-1,7-dioic acid hydratase in catechol pathway [Arthrobacter stackebrandtii]|uniref:2-keto-4-pentenoate hydratase/2-oxohepta-3-ene-1,7-dioic acid hydratase in catechol pathway n=1 Tax=Arthrobacter stackebrandtii TaxID=272161 RepID=A0ABS4YYS5_9MICC|nr:fumarylacetoacetate hydrolase family protein [Arthrobacter stackebrandtii]MBP2413951.1 2-keto-4-pentenoate hydratase/2-oxohepta-3-ene-1,7-dioic acid hydratase in catechol pathway [Arthrobacter stackebrandtii]PYH00512.1 fumarylacetoacetate hydrolase [Arthrobacter stackebrandtii]
MTFAPHRLARVRPSSPAQEGPGAGAGPALPEQFFVRNDAAGFDSPEGRIWQVVETPFPTSPANQNSSYRDGWTLGATVTEDEFTFLAPCAPVNVFGMAHNTGAPGRALPPQAFHKAASSVVGPGDAIELCPGTGYTDPEAELTVVIGRPAKNLTLENARSAILGFTIGNDVSDRDAQKSDELWLSAKSPDTFTPLGPWIVVGLKDDGVAISIVHNGTELSPASSDDLGWGVDEILVYLSAFMTLQPGDVIMTGFPAECRRINPGDEVICRIEGIGELRNPVAAGQ